MSTVLLEVGDLTVTYTTRGGSSTVVSGMSFGLDHGELVGLVGESGSGKSAAIHAIAGLPRPVKTTITGAVRLDGQDVLTMSHKELRQIHGTELAFVGQNPFGCLQPTLALHKQFHNVLKAHRRTGSKAQSRTKAEAALEAVGIPEPNRVLRGYAHQLSGGMAQRVVIAMATVLEPRLLFADEPTTALDPTVQVQILDVLAGLRDQRGTAILIVTHDLGVVAQYCSRAMVMHDGRMVEEGSVSALFDAPKHPYTQELLGADLAAGGKA